MGRSNTSKLKEEREILKAYMIPHWERFLKRPFDGHSYVNLFVESRRISPYLTGHVDAVLYPLLIILAVANGLLLM